MASSSQNERNKLRQFLTILSNSDTELQTKESEAQAQILTALVELDSRGFLLGPAETLESAYRRGLKLCQQLDQLEADLSKQKELYLSAYDITLDADQIIASDIIDQASQITEEFYQFHLGWIPGYYQDISAWRLWGGCALGDSDAGIAMFLLRSEFSQQDKYLIYDRQEILAHELCHLAHWSFTKDLRLEEFFAYQTSPKWLRRYLGNCFTSLLDTVLFVIPSMATVVAQLCRLLTNASWSMTPFWVAAALGPAFLLVKNHVARQRYFAAEKNLTKLGLTAVRPLLFRCTWDELPQLAALESLDQLRQYASKQKDLRWQVIQQRFIC